MRPGDGDDDARLADADDADAMMDRAARARPALVQLAADLLQRAQRHRLIGFVLELDRPLSGGPLAGRADEDDRRPVVGMLDQRSDLGRVERLGADAAGGCRRDRSAAAVAAGYRRQQRELVAAADELAVGGISFVAGREADGDQAGVGGIGLAQRGLQLADGHLGPVG